MSLDNSVFTALTDPGLLAASAFVVAIAAFTPDQHVISNQAASTLFYDRDGSGPIAQIAFAEVTPGLTLGHSDFWVV